MAPNLVYYQIQVSSTGPGGWSNFGDVQASAVQ
jgi:hypothetical protein